MMYRDHVACSEKHGMDIDATEIYQVSNNLSKVSILR